MNRALASQYPPGSVFKVVVAAAGLQEGRLTPMDRMYCNGEFHMGGWTFKDWKEGGHGHVDLRSALVQSCNIYFYQSGLKVGAEAIVRYARAFGLGSLPQTELGGEKPGLVPMVAPARSRRARNWQAGDTINISIGQGRLLVTPLQVARMMSAVANGGILWKPRLVKSVERADGTLAYESSSKMSGQVDLSPAVWAFLRHALAGAVNEGGGTGGAARIPGVLVAGQDRHGAEHREKRCLQGTGSRVVCLVRTGGRSPGRRGRPGRARGKGWTGRRPDRPEDLPGAVPRKGCDDRARRRLLMLRFDRRLLLNVDWILVATTLFIIMLSVLSLWSLAPRGGERPRLAATVVGGHWPLGDAGRHQHRLPPARPRGAGLLPRRLVAALDGVRPRPHRVGGAPVDPPGSVHGAAVGAVQADLRAGAGMGA